MSETVKNQESPKEAQYVLLGSIAYNNPEDYQKFLENLEPNQALLVLIAAVKHAYNRPGTYTMEESELAMKAIRQIVKMANSKEEPVQPSST